MQHFLAPDGHDAAEDAFGQAGAEDDYVVFWCYFVHDTDISGDSVVFKEIWCAVRPGTVVTEVVSQCFSGGQKCSLELTWGPVDGGMHLLGSLSENVPDL